MDTQVADAKVGYWCLHALLFQTKYILYTYIYYKNNTLKTKSISVFSLA